ncbi:MAG: M6 family metalloprotease domain-containing protein [Fuerstiella sp.]
MRIFGDEFYARYETNEGYTVVVDKDYGCYCYALLATGRFLSSGIPIGKPLPDGVSKHLKEDPDVRNEKFEQNYSRLRPREIDPDLSATRTIGPDNGLLNGRKLHQGTVRGLTILVEFDDVTSSISRDDVDEMFNAANYSGNGNFCSVNRYFQIVSSGKLDYVNTVVGPVKLSRRRGHYINNLLVEEALNIAVNDFNVDLSEFDSRDEGIVDAINFLYAGDSQYSGDLWPHNSVKRLQYGDMRTHYHQLTGLGSHVVDLKIGTIGHENGHLLCRFPDMYDDGKRDGDFEKSQGIGRYCLMGSGNHLNGRRTPSPVCAYLRELAGWVDEVILLDSPDRITAQHGAYDKAWKFETNLPNEYFMIENRSQRGLDAHLPSSGLAIYHCDTLGSNEWQDGTRNKHYQCAVLQADGSLDLENNRNAGDSTDLFVGIPGVAVSDETTPSSRNWNGTDSGLVVSEVGVAGQNITFTVGNPQVQPIADVKSFPNLLIPDNDPNGVTTSLSIDSAGEIIDISASVEIVHSWISDLKVSLVAPDGSVIVLHDREGADGDDIHQTYDSATTPDLANLAGNEVAGDWSLVVVDKASQDVGRLVEWGLVVRYDRHSTTVTGSANSNVEIPDNSFEGVSSKIKIQQEGDLENIAVEVDIEHTYIGDLRVELISPSEQVVRLHDRAGGRNNDIKRSYDSTSTPDLNDLQGESIRGKWRLRVRDLAARDIGTLVSWSITIEY